MFKEIYAHVTSLAGGVGALRRASGRGEGCDAQREWFATSPGREYSQYGCQTISHALFRRNIDPGGIFRWRCGSYVMDKVGEASPFGGGRWWSRPRPDSEGRSRTPAQRRGESFFAKAAMPLLRCLECEPDRAHDVECACNGAGHCSCVSPSSSSLRVRIFLWLCSSRCLGGATLL